MEETLKRVKEDRTHLDDLYAKGAYNMKASILARLVDGINERYALKKTVSGDKK
jgi:hypothetical protein